MSQHVAADAQFGAARILRPIDKFEELYQGKSAVVNPFLFAASIPIALFEWEDGKPPDPRDDQAGQPGFNANLMRFLKVPFGALVKIKIPGIFNGATPIGYRYIVTFRDNTLGRYQQTGVGPYHIPVERLGAADTSVPPFNIGGTGPRVLLPAGTRTVVFNRPEPVNPVLAATHNMRREYINVLPGEVPFAPIIGPTDTDLGVYQQGVTDPAFDLANGYFPTFMEFVFESTGDEMMITIDRECIQGDDECLNATWDFSEGGFDQGFANIYGRNALGLTPHPPFPNAGVYVFTGTAP